ncbi:MAG: hypothetical protein LBJ45_02640 [Holosporaceae bacterium]|nr:hypothetical protein [Holosporaceae bacterium]
MKARLVHCILARILAELLLIDGKRLKPGVRDCAKKADYEYECYSRITLKMRYANCGNRKLIVKQ